MKIFIKSIVATVLLVQLCVSSLVHAITFISSQTDLDANADAADYNDFSSEVFDSDSSMDSATNIWMYAGSVGADASTPSASSSSSISFDASYSPNLITASGDASASAYSSGMANASAYSTANHAISFSSVLPVDYVFNAMLVTLVGDGYSSVSLQNLSDGSYLFSSDVSAFSEETLFFTGTLAPGTYTFRAYLSASSFAEEYYSSGIEGYGSFNAALELTSVPVPAALWLFISGLVGLVGVSYRIKTNRANGQLH